MRKRTKKKCVVCGEVVLMGPPQKYCALCKTSVINLNASRYNKIYYKERMQIWNSQSDEEQLRRTNLTSKYFLAKADKEAIKIYKENGIQ